MNSPRVKLSVKDGKLQMEAENVSGPFCKNMLDEVTHSLNGVVVSEEPKPELYEADSLKQQERLRQTE